MTDSVTFKAVYDYDGNGIKDDIVVADNNQVSIHFMDGMGRALKTETIGNLGTECKLPGVEGQEFIRNFEGIGAVSYAGRRIHVENYYATDPLARNPREASRVVLMEGRLEADFHADYEATKYTGWEKPSKK